MHSVHIRSKSMAKDYCPDAPWAAISIDSYDEWPKLYAVKRVGLLRISFYDAVMPSLAFPDITLFDETHANQILDFVEQVKDKVEYLLVHCEAGVSRSAAVAAVIEQCYIGSANILHQINQPRTYRPNPLVYDILGAEAVKRGFKVAPTEDVNNYWRLRKAIEEYGYIGRNCKS